MDTSTEVSVDDMIASDLGNQNDENARVSFDRPDSDLPDLPVDEDSSINEYSGLSLPSDREQFDEHAMRRQLMDVESSFLPDVASYTVQQESRLGVDDTYLELGKPGHTPPPDEMFASLSGRRMSKHLRAVGVEPASESHDSSASNEEDMDTMEHSNGDAANSSPALAASRRTHARMASDSSAKKSIYSDLMQKDSRPTTPASQRPASKGSTVRPDSAHNSENATPKQEADHLYNSIESSPSRFATRRVLLHSRQASQSSSSSRATESDISGSEAAVNEDYALQTGGAVPDHSVLSSTHRRHLLSRLPSFGSIGSLADRDHESENEPGNDFGHRPKVSSVSGGRLLWNGEERPETPRAPRNPIDLPTDTVIAQHVQSIYVPDTIARDFRARNRSLSPNKQRPVSSGVAGLGTAPRRTLTLKEQNSKIDKLTKENFDLKLKIHFLDQALQNRSDEGVKELIDKNVQLQTDLANERKDSQSSKRKARELEQKVVELEEALSQARDQHHKSFDSDDEAPTLQAEMHEEILWLRQQLDHSENRVTTLTEEVMTKELEKRKMAEHMRSMAGNRGEDTSGIKETMDMWQDLLNAETGRREQAEEDMRKLREELTALKVVPASPSWSRGAGRRGVEVEGSVAAESEYTNGINGGSTGGSSATLVEQLKHENAELRRDLGAQTSMLTSRNRERERLQQEIEDLKLLQRKSDGARSIAGDSIFDRSISRAHHHRAPSRASEAATHVTETERDDWDKKEGHLRDQNAELRLKFQELERTHTTHVQYVSVLEADFQQMENELNEAADDLRGIQAERDDALNALHEKEAELEKLEAEALAEIEKLEKESSSLQFQLKDARDRHQKTQHKLEHTADGYKNLQSELRDITQSVMSLEDEKQSNVRTIQTLEQQLGEIEDELQKWEAKCKEIDQKNRKLEITQESLHSEITFLREEQEADKIKIGELEDAVGAAQQSIYDEQEKLREMEEAMIEERQQRDVLENKSKEDVQKVLDDLNSDNQKSKDEVRKLRRGVSAKEVEASGWKQKLEELEQSLRHLIGDPNGTKQSLLGEVEKLQRDLETTTNHLDRVKMEMADKERLLRHRDGLLESTSLESRRLSDLLDKERASRRHDLDQFERASRGQATHLRTIAQHESRVLELEDQFTQDRRRMAALEEQYREQLSERNNLLFALWNRLSTLCGADWAQYNSLVEGELPSADVIARKLGPFNRNLLQAVKTVEGLIGSFKVRIRGVEKDLWKDYETLEHNLEMRIKRMDNLERAVHDTQKALANAEEPSQKSTMSRATSFRSTKGQEEIGKLRGEIKVLKAELKFHRQHPSAMAQQMLNQQAQLSPEQSRRLSTSGSGSIKSGTSPARAIMSTLLRHHSTSTIEQAPDVIEDTSDPLQQNIVVSSSHSNGPSEQRWVHRLKELERRLKAEREARLLDRRGARQRLEEGRLQNEELKQMLEHERMRREMQGEVGSLMESQAGDERTDEEGQMSSGVD